MSITKIDDLRYEREFPSYVDGMNDSQDIKFNKEGLEIDYDILSWDEIKTAYKTIFKENIFDT